MIEKLRCLSAGDQSRRKPGTKARTMPVNWINPSMVR
jgi:hypothetical protein